jgi:hypothetical protein
MRPLLLLAALSVLLSSSCYPPGDGKPPPVEELYFPTGLALDGLSKSDDPEFSADCNELGKPCPPKYLYVGNSDFDLQYSGGSVVAYDLDRLRKILPRVCNGKADCLGNDICDTAIPDSVTEPAPSYFCVNPSEPKPCGALGERDEADRVISPGRCDSIDPIAAKVLIDAVGIGAFSTDVLWRPTDPKSGAAHPSRLYIPVRGDSTLHWIDIDLEGKETEDGKSLFVCGQNGTDENGCDSLHRAGDAPAENRDALRQPPEPYAVDATAHGEFVAVTNQTSGSVSLYADEGPSGPRLVSILTGLPVSPVGIAALPSPAPELAENPEYPLMPGFLVAYRTAAQIDLLRVYSAPPVINPVGEPYTDHVLFRAGSTPINASSLGFDSRGIAIDDAQRQADYEKCKGAAAAELKDCLRAAHQPGVYVASRAPASLLVGAMTADVTSPSGSNELPSFTPPVSLTFGPSRVILGNVKVQGTRYHDSAGPYELERRVFVVCFDSRRIFVYNPKKREIEAIVSTGRGPYALVTDDLRGLAYIGHFTDSYLGVISLDQRFSQTYAAIVASIGAPKAPRSSK